MNYHGARTLAFFLIASTSCGNVRSRAENDDERKTADYMNKFSFKHESPLSSSEYKQSSLFR